MLADIAYPALADGDHRHISSSLVLGEPELHKTLDKRVHVPTAVTIRR